jgi:hypothetical protein
LQGHAAGSDQVEPEAGDQLPSGEALVECSGIAADQEAQRPSPGAARCLANDGHLDLALGCSGCCAQGQSAHRFAVGDGQWGCVHSWRQVVGRDFDRPFEPTALDRHIEVHRIAAAKKHPARRDR